MSFLRLTALWALPLVLIPIVIHLLHRRRQPSMPWAATLFITRANQSRRAPAKLWRYLILATRTLVVAALVFAVARPLSVSQGSFAWLANRATDDALTIVLVDRSPSMQRQLPTGRSRLRVALEQVAQTIDLLAGGKMVLIDSVLMEPMELADPGRLLSTPFTRSCDASADVPGMLSVAADYLDRNGIQIADVWLVSDQQSVDWRPDSPRWNELQNRFEKKSPGVKVHLTPFEANDRSNTSVQVTQCDWESAGKGSGVRLSLRVKRAITKTEAGNLNPVSVRIEMAGKTSVVEVPITPAGNVESGNVESGNVDYQGKLNDYWLPLSDRAMAWGTVAIAADRAPADDRCFFSAVNDLGPAIRLTVQEPCVALQAAAEVLGNPQTSKSGAAEVPASLWIWQGELPNAEAAAEVTRFAQSGGRVLFFPPIENGVSESSNATEFDGVSWRSWSTNSTDNASNNASNDQNRDAQGWPTQLEDWRFVLDRYREVQGDVVKVASTAAGQCWLGKRSMGSGAVWFCGADVSQADSTLVQDGVALLAIVSRAIGEANMNDTSTDVQSVGWIAGQTPESMRGLPWKRSKLDPWGYDAGVFFLDGGSTPRCEVVNCPAEESDDQTVPKPQVVNWFPNAAWHRIDSALVGESSSQPGSDISEGAASGFVREVWAAVWIVLIVGMLLEAWLSLPRSNSRFEP